MTPATRWLDFGCGNGALVRYLREHGVPLAEGFDEGAIVPEAVRAGIPVHPWHEISARKYDVVTAIEVLEHVVEPLEVLRKIRGLLNPGGIFFYTTMNPRARLGALTKWSYLAPDVHSSFYHPQTMDRALRNAGFCPVPPSANHGWDLIYANRILKNLRVKRWSGYHAIVPWRLLAAALELRFQYTAYPLGRA